MTALSQDFSFSNNFSLHGFVHGRDSGYLVLRYPDFQNKITLDTTYLINGRFQFKGKISEPSRASIVGYRKIIDFNDVNIVSFYIEPGEQSIELVENNYANAIIHGFTSQKEWDTLSTYLDSINAKYKNIDKRLIEAKYAYQKASSEEEKKEALKRQGELVNELAPRIRETIKEDIQFILQHPDSYVSANILYYPINDLPLDSAQALFNTLSSRIRNSRSGKYIADLLRKKRQTADNSIAYNFKAIDAHGNNISLSDFSGKYVLLNFWASWCGPCRAEMPYLKGLYAQYHSKGLEIIAISIDHNLPAWKKTIGHDRIENWHNVLVNKDINDNYDNPRQPIPSQILVGPNGKIAWKWNSGGTLDAVLKKFIR